MQSAPLLPYAAFSAAFFSAAAFPPFSSAFSSRRRLRAISKACLFLSQRGQRHDCRRHAAVFPSFRCAAPCLSFFLLSLLQMPFTLLPDIAATAGATPPSAIAAMLFLPLILLFSFLFLSSSATPIAVFVTPKQPPTRHAPPTRQRHQPFPAENAPRRRHRHQQQRRSPRRQPCHPKRRHSALPVRCRCVIPQCHHQPETSHARSNHVQQTLPPPFAQRLCQRY
jgi:hypothetical protein